MSEVNKYWARLMAPRVWPYIGSFVVFAGFVVFIAGMVWYGMV